MDKEKLSAAIAIVLALALVIAMLGSWKKDIVVDDIVEFDVASIIMEDPLPLPEVETKEALLPEILPPLYEEPLPPLQGEV